MMRKAQKAILLPRGRRKYIFMRLGIGSERHILELLRNATGSDGSPLFTSVTNHRHRTNSRYDGKDFTVRKFVGDHLKEVSFSVTISEAGLIEARRKFPHIPVFHTPLDFNRAKFVRKIEQLFR